MYKNFSIFIILIKFLENIFQFFALGFLLTLLLFVLYAIFALGNSNALDCLEPIIKPITNFAYFLFGRGKDNFGFLQEFITGITALSLLFLVSQLIKLRLAAFGEFLKNAKDDCRRFEDRQLNKKLHKDAQKMNKKISKGIIYLEIKKKERVIEHVDIDEQTKMLNQFLFNNTGRIPTKYGEGYVFKIPDFEKIDTKLAAFFKAINSNAPIDYMVILQAIENGEAEAFVEILKLKNSRIYNTILLSPTTNVRYEYNDAKSYNTGVIGNYIIDNEDITIFELRERFF